MMMPEQHALRILPTEEAFAIPEQMAEMRKVVDGWSSGYDPDLFLWDKMLRGGPLTRRLLDLEEERIAIMDECGVAMQLLSLTSTGVQMLAPDTAVAVARIANDRLAEVIGRHPTRFAGLATVAPQDPARAVKELERAITTLGLNGLVINSHTDGEYLSDRKYWPILEAAAALDAPLYIHPRSPTPLMAAAYREDHLEHAIWGYQAETGLHGLRLITSGVFDAFPNLKVILGHMGEGIPYWFYRIDYMHELTKSLDMVRADLKQKPSDYFRQNFAITTSGVNWDPPLKFNLDVLGPDNVMFAVDYPYQETGEAVDWLRNADIPADVKAKVASGNAERIFKIKAPAR
jgi:predicted TIM-barrel fold metal-dependent hydrolase